MPKKKAKNHNPLEEMKKLFNEEKEGNRKSQSAEKPLRLKGTFKKLLQTVVGKKG